MEVLEGHNNRIKVCLIEMIGTCMLVLAINFGSKSGSTLVLYQAEAISLTLFLLAFSLGPISGGHFNPAVTVAVFIKEGKKNYSNNILYALQIIVSQLVGAIGGCLLTLLGLTYSQYPNELWPGIAILCPPNIVNTADVFKDRQQDCMIRGRSLGAFYGEVISTCIFVTVILTIKYHKSSGVTLFDAQAIALALYGCIKFTVGISGSALNPAFGLIQSIFQLIMFNFRYSDNKMTLNSFWIFTFGPLCGGILAGYASILLAVLYRKKASHV